jgi:hypothetical protein
VCCNRDSHGRKTDLTDLIAQVIDDLREARRYVRINPTETKRLTGISINGLCIASLNDKIPPLLYSRLVRNLGVGQHFVLVAPGVLAGYIDGAILELQDWAAKEGL